MRSVGTHSTSGREKEGNEERMDYYMGILVYVFMNVCLFVRACMYLHAHFNILYINDGFEGFSTKHHILRQYLCNLEHMYMTCYPINCAFFSSQTN